MRLFVYFLFSTCPEHWLHFLYPLKHVIININSLFSFSNECIAYTPEAGKAGNPPGIIFSLHIFKPSSNKEGRSLVCRIFFDPGIHGFAWLFFYLDSFPVARVFLYPCPTDACWDHIFHAEMLHTPPFAWHGLNFNPKTEVWTESWQRSETFTLSLPFPYCTELELTLENQVGEL